MDFNNRVGHRTGSGAPASAQQLEVERRERLRKLALETIDISKDPYIHRNHVGKIECRLCLTLHINEASYLTHTQCRKHQNNLRARSLKELRHVENVLYNEEVKKNTIVIANKQLKNKLPKYIIKKVSEKSTSRLGLLITIFYDDILADVEPEYKILNYFEQKVEPENETACYIAFSALPYSNIAIRLPAADISRNENDFLTSWDVVNKKYVLQFLFNKLPIGVLKFKT